MRVSVFTTKDKLYIAMLGYITTIDRPADTDRFDAPALSTDTEELPKHVVYEGEYHARSKGVGKGNTITRIAE